MHHTIAILIAVILILFLIILFLAGAQSRSDEVLDAAREVVWSNGNPVDIAKLRTEISIMDGGGE